MSIRYIVHNSSFCPVVFCDFCGKRIESAREGNVLFLMDYDKGIDLATVFIHKSCDKLLSQQGFYGNELVPWEEMRNFVNHLTWNLAYGGENIISSVIELFDCSNISFYSDKKEIPSRMCGVYLLWNYDELWYVGQSTDIKIRLTGHRYYDKAVSTTRIGVIEVADETRRLVIEACLTNLLSPRACVQWKSPSYVRTYATR